jgi:hypothetical protein
VAEREFKQAVTGGDVGNRVPDIDRRVADVGRHHREPQESSQAWRNVALDHSARRGIQFLIPHLSLVRQHVTPYYQIGQRARSGERKANQSELRVSSLAFR